MTTLQALLLDTASTLTTFRKVTSEFPLQERLQHSLGANYTLERELSGAGMSRVFVANEPALGRKVVVKVMPNPWLNETQAGPLDEEIRLSASLQQANIIPVLSAGIAAGFAYYTMPLVEERSLLERLKREGALPLRNAVSILRDVARALAYAHAHGVVHRDIKPGNILLSGGSAVVADFGIAKTLGASLRRSLPGTTATVGFGIGTPDYMAPEQALGDASADHRADLYSFGCLAYAVFTGKAPFHGRSATETIAAHLIRRPTPLSLLRPEVPSRLSALVARCLEKDPAMRPQSANEVLDELEAASAPAPSAWTLSKLLIAIAAGAVALLGISH